jgi:presenilin 1
MLAIIFGLVSTLLLLSIYRKALPALPFSLLLGIVFYVLARFCLDPFVVAISTNMLYL